MLPNNCVHQKTCLHKPTYLQVVPLFLPPHYFPMCQNRRKNSVWNWPPSEMTESWTCHPPKMAQSRTLVSLGVKSCGLCHCWGWQVLDSVILDGGQFRTLFFLPSLPPLITPCVTFFPNNLSLKISHITSFLSKVVWLLVRIFMVKLSQHFYKICFMSF